MPKKKKKVKYIIYLCISESSTSIHPTLQTGQPGRFSDFLLLFFFFWKAGKSLQCILWTRFLPRRWIILVPKLLLNFSVDETKINCPRTVSVAFTRELRKLQKSEQRGHLGQHVNQGSIPVQAPPQWRKWAGKAFHVQIFLFIFFPVMKPVLHFYEIA